MRTCHYCKAVVDDDTLVICPCGAGLPAVHPTPPDPAGDPKTAAPIAPGSTISAPDVSSIGPKPTVARLVAYLAQRDQNDELECFEFAGIGVAVVLEPSITVDPTVTVQEQATGGDTDAARPAGF